MAVKDNQGKLADALRDFFAEAQTGGFGVLPVSRHETVEKDHGRIESRRALWVSELAWLDRPIRQHWPKLAGVGMMERTRARSTARHRPSRRSTSDRRASPMLRPSPRQHAVIGASRTGSNVTFQEDDCRVRKGHAPQNPSALRKFALSLLRQDKQYPKRSLRGRRKAADRPPNYRASLLGFASLG